MSQGSNRKGLLGSDAQEAALFQRVLSPELRDNPYLFVMAVFPWGVPNTPLAKKTGPRKWQKELLLEIAGHIAANGALDDADLWRMFRDATCSGRGIGKSALLSWLVMWFMSTRLGGTCIVTANTEAQLKSRTWAELGKWHTMAANAHWFERTVLSMKPAAWFEELLKTQLKIDTTYYYAQAQLWSEENPDAFAGVHNEAGILLMMDEASGIPQAIFDVSEGFFTEKTRDRFWLLFSNPRRNTGAFYECFHANRAFWTTRHIDSRTVEGTDLETYERIIAQNGENSDVARIEVLGQFPGQGEKQFIGRDLVREAQERPLPSAENDDPLIMGIDVARFGVDATIVRFRRGRDARSIPRIAWHGMDDMQKAYRIAELIDKHKPDAVCIDSGGGSGVIDKLRLLGYLVHEVHFGSTKTRDPKWYNKRTEMWGECRDWLSGGCIDTPVSGNKNDAGRMLGEDLVKPEYHYIGGKQGEGVCLQAKAEMKGRSTDDADALVLTFGVRVPKRDHPLSRAGRLVESESSVEIQSWASI